jgi:hypothetical protein
VIAWASSGHVGFKGSRKSTPFAAQLAAENAARKAQEHGVKKVDVFVKGPGSGRETAIRSLQAAGLEVGHLRRHPAAAQRLPSAQAAPGLGENTMARYTGPITRKSRRLGVDLVGGDQSFEKRPYPPGQHGRARIKESEYRQQLQEKQKARFTYGVLEKQFRSTTRRPCASPARPARTCCRSWRAVWTTSCTAPVWRAPAGWPASWSATGTSPSTA